MSNEVISFSSKSIPGLFFMSHEHLIHLSKAPSKSPLPCFHKHQLLHSP
jgi:hypothetical protein